MEHLSVLSAEERVAVSKFQEYGCTMMIGYGNKATWSDLVHSDAYSDEAISAKVVELRSKVNKQEEAADEDGIINVNEFYTLDRGKNKVYFTTKEVLLVVRAARKSRKYFSDIKEIQAIEAEIQKIDMKTMTKEERLASQKDALTQRLAKLKGTPATTEAETTKEATN
jgi:hypothetical protein